MQYLKSQTVSASSVFSLIKDTFYIHFQLVALKYLCVRHIGQGYTGRLCPLRFFSISVSPKFKAGIEIEIENY